MFSHPLLSRAETDAHRQDLARAAQRHQLAALAGKTPSPRLSALVMAGVGRVLVNVGTGLQTRAGVVTQGQTTVRLRLDQQAR